MTKEIILPHKCDFKPNGFDPMKAVCRICGKNIMEQEIEIPEPEIERPLEFRKYRSITNDYKARFIQKVRDEGADRYEWVAVLKIHGANYSVHANAEEVKAARKGGWIEADESFFINDRVFPFASVFAKAIQSYFGKNVAVYFEMFGGFYPHPDVSSVDGAMKIQKEVKYAPYNDVRVIDIVVDGKYLDFDEMEEIVERFSLTQSANGRSQYAFKIAPVILRGHFEDIVNVDPVFPDPLYKEYKLPEIEDNQAEGVVIRPVKEVILSNGKRCIIKRKNPKFLEKKRTPKVHTARVISTELQAAIDEFETYVNENRLRNILSHGKKFTSKKEFPELAGLMMQDILEEEGDDDDVFTALSDEEMKDFKKMGHKIVCSFVGPLFPSIIGGYF